MKVNKIIAGIMAVCVMGCGVPYVSTVADNTAITASAESEAEYTDDGTYEQLTYLNYGDHIEIFDCDESATEVVIPSEIEGVPVTSIGKWSFYDCRSLTSVTIPDSVTSIAYRAFHQCSSLTEINIPDSVTSISESAFAGCTSLTSITLPDSVISIDRYAFKGCSSLTSINIPDSVTKIYKGAFSDTPWLEEKRKENPFVIVNNILIDAQTCTGDVIIPDSVTSIGNSVFRGCTGLTSITLPDSVTTIGYEAFHSCENLASINIPDSVTSIGDSAFFGTAWLEAKRKENPLVIVNNILIDGKACEGDIVIPNGVTNIQSYTFYSCVSLKSVTIPNSVTTIGYNAFLGCESLASINIPDSLTSIGYNAFYGCSSLTSITIPDSVTYIGHSTFHDCSSLTSITILNPDCEIYDAAYTISNYADSYFHYYNGTIYGYENSTAQAYAEKYDRKFVSLGKTPEKETSTGDMNGDNSINISDAVFLQNCILGKQELTEEHFKNADMTGDGFVDSFDLVLLKRKAVYGE